MRLLRFFLFLIALFCFVASAWLTRRTDPRAGVLLAAGLAAIALYETVAAGRALGD